MQPTASRAAFDNFPSAFRGTLLRPDDQGYATARLIFNMRRADARPAVIARPIDETDVAVSLRHASAHALPVAIRGGGHGVDGTAMPDNALVLDMTGFKTIQVDAGKRIIRAGAGVLLGEIDVAAQAYGLVVPSGTVSSTGIAGLTLGGGVGTLMRRFGATVDNLIGCTLVTLDGDVVTASATENAALFWALRGGGGNFGVVTTFEYRAHRLDHDVTAGMILFPFEQSEEILTTLAGWMPTAPRELGLIAALLGCPPLPSVPADMVGRPVLVLVVVHSGRPETAGPVLDHLIGLGSPVVTMVQPTPWVKANSMLDAVAVYGRRYYTRGGYLSLLSTEAIGVFRATIAQAPSPVRPVRVWSTTSGSWAARSARTSRRTPSRSPARARPSSGSASASGMNRSRTTCSRRGSMPRPRSCLCGPTAIPTCRMTRARRGGGACGDRPTSWPASGPSRRSGTLGTCFGSTRTSLWSEGRSCPLSGVQQGSYSRHRDSGPI
jgi:hypothetical protein